MYANNSSGAMSPSLAGIAALLMTAPDYEVWPDNMQSIDLFVTMKTQLRTGGMSGFIGFDYTPFFVRMDRMKLSEQEYEWLFDDVRVIESVAISELNKKD